MQLTDPGFADIRPRLRNDVVFLRVETGIYLRSSEVSCVLKGRGVYEWMSALGPRMTGEWTVAELCGGLDEARRGTAQGLVRTLLDRGFARDASSSDAVELPEPVRRQFASQVNFVEHFMHGDARSPQALFDRFRNSRVLVAGPSSGIADAAVRGLLRNGIAQVSVTADAYTPAAFEADLAELAAAGTPAEVIPLPGVPADLLNYDVVVCAVVSETSATLLELTRRILGAAGGADLRLLPVVTDHGKAVLGPISGPAEQPCWLCAQLRLSANTDPRRSADFWRALALGPRAGGDGGVSAIAQRMIGNALAFEVFRLRTGQLGPSDEGSAVVQDLRTLESTRARVLPHPQCPMPHEVPAPRVEEQPITEQQSHARAEVLVSPSLGVLSGWTDETIKQIPIKIGRVRLGYTGSLADGPREIAAFDTDVILDARARAVRSAISTYIGRLGPLDSTSLTADADADAGTGSQPEKIAAERLDGYSGASTFGADRSPQWVAASSLHDGSSWRVPAAAVYPFSPANADLQFEPTSAGAAADWNLAPVKESGLCSALAYRAALAAVRSGTPLHRLDESLLAADDEITFLMDSLRHLDLRPRVLALPGATPAFAALVVIDSATAGQRPEWSIGARLSGVAAVRASLRDAVGSTVIRHYEGTSADLGDPLIAGLDPRVFSDAGTSVDRSFDRPAATVADVLAALEATGTHALFADTTTIDCRSVGGLVAGTVVLAEK